MVRIKLPDLPELYNILKEETVQGESNKDTRDYAMATNGGLTVGMCNRLL